MPTSEKDQSNLQNFFASSLYLALINSPSAFKVWIFFRPVQVFFARSKLSKNLEKFRITFQHLYYVTKWVFLAEMLNSFHKKSMYAFESEISKKIQIVDGG